MRKDRLLVLMVLSMMVAGSDLYAQRGRRGGGPGFAMLNFSYELISPAGVGGTVQASNPNLKVDVTSLGIKLNLPPIGVARRRPGGDGERGERGGRGWMIVHSLGYQQHHIDYENFSSAAAIDRLNRVNGIEYDLTFIGRFSRKWRTLLQVNPGLFSDLENNVDSDHWKIQGGVLLDRVFAESGFTAGLGACWSTAFGEYMLLPVVHLETNPRENPHLRVMLPVVAEVTWRTDLGVDIGGAVRIDGGQYGLGAFNSGGTAGRINRLRYSNVTAGPFLAFGVSRGLKLILEGGGTLHRRFETWREDTKVDDYELKNASFFRLGLRSGI